MIIMMNKITYDLDTEEYLLNGKYWAHRDDFGEEMAEIINDLLEKYHKIDKAHMRVIEDFRYQIKYGLENNLSLEEVARNLGMIE